MEHIARAAKRVGRPSGRRLDPAREEAILRAAIEALTESGFDRLTMDDIAARARAGKSTLYRRWPSKTELVLDAIQALNWQPTATPGAAALPPGPSPGPGSLRADIEAVLRAVVEPIPMGGSAELEAAEATEAAKATGATDAASGISVLRILASLATAACGDAALATQLAQPLLDPPRRQLARLLDLAKARGELPPSCPSELLADLVVGAALMRLLNGETPDLAFLHRVVDEVVLPFTKVGDAR